MVDIKGREADPELDELLINMPFNNKKYLGLPSFHMDYYGDAHQLSHLKAFAVMQDKSSYGFYRSCIDGHLHIFTVKGQLDVEVVDRTAGRDAVITFLQENFSVTPDREYARKNRIML